MEEEALEETGNGVVTRTLTTPFHYWTSTFQVRSVKYIPKHNAWKGIVTTPLSGRDRIVPVDFDWVESNFSENFIKAVQEQAGRGKRFLAIPPGDNFDEAYRLQVPDGCYRKEAPPVEYQIPPLLNTCLSSSMASALHYKGYKEGARKLYFEGVAAVTRGKVAGMVNNMITLARDGTNKKYVPHRIRGRNSCLLELGEVYRNDHKVLMIVAIISASDGEATHAVTVADGWIFEANLERALPLTRESLNYCCGGTATPYIGIHLGYVFQSHQHHARKKRKTK